MVILITKDVFMARFQKTSATVVQTSIGNALSSDGRMRFHPIITYRYSVGGQDYMNDQFSQRFVGMSRGLAQGTIDKHSVNSQIEIYYNVNDPAESFIQKALGNWQRSTLP